MRHEGALACLAILLFACAGCGGEQETADAVDTTKVFTPDENVAALKQMCEADAEAMQARQAEQSLYARLGGRDAIHAVVADTVRRHQANDQIKHLLEGVDIDHLVAQVTDFLVVGTGGEGEYHGRDMAEAHAHLELSNVEFLAAAQDLRDAMDAAGVGEEEHQEVFCAFMSFVDEVVTR